MVLGTLYLFQISNIQRRMKNEEVLGKSYLILDTCYLILILMHSIPSYPQIQHHLGLKG